MTHLWQALGLLAGALVAARAFRILTELPSETEQPKGTARRWKQKQRGLRAAQDFIDGRARP